MFTTTQRLAVGDEINLIVDAKLEDDLRAQTKRRKQAIKIFAEVDRPLRAEFFANGKTIVVEGAVCQAAQKQPLSREELQSNFNKSELFEAQLEIVKLENVFVAKQQLNEFRRNVFDKIKAIFN